LGRPSSPNSFYEGIDFLRAGAVFLVLWSHGGSLLPDQQRFFLYFDFFRPGFWGVTIFFAISGFLIVGQLFDIAAGARRESLRAFVIRRCLRTMPTYWLVILLVLIVGMVQWPPPNQFGANLLFLQSFLEVPSVLPVAWSLVIEVWSYFIFAALALASREVSKYAPESFALHRWLSSGASLILASLIILPLVAGLIRYDLSLAGASVQSVKQGVLPQLDALAYGGILAWVRRARPKMFERVLSWRFLAPLCAICMSLVPATAPFLFGNVEDPLPAGVRFWIAFGFYPSAGLLSCLLIVAFWKFRYSSMPAWVVVPCRSLSRWSYSVYLLHLYVAVILAPIGVGLAPFLAYLVLSIVVGAGGWYLLEKPFSRLRYAFS
jgi:peptidoglycan/LPS O-acetylase OafA/YrhL